MRTGPEASCSWLGASDWASGTIGKNVVASRISELPAVLGDPAIRAFATISVDTERLDLVLLDAARATRHRR